MPITQSQFLSVLHPARAESQHYDEMTKVFANFDDLTTPEEMLTMLRVAVATHRQFFRIHVELAHRIEHYYATMTPASIARNERSAAARRLKKRQEAEARRAEVLLQSGPYTREVLKPLTTAPARAPDPDRPAKLATLREIADSEASANAQDPYAPKPDGSAPDLWGDWTPEKAVAELEAEDRAKRQR